MILRHRKETGASTLLNILGMAAAFAALYIILVQVNWSLGYNKALPDAERVYCVSMPNPYDEGHYSVWMPRPVLERMLSRMSEVERYGVGYLQGGKRLKELLTFGEDYREKVMGVSTMLSEGLVDIIGVELVEGSWDNFTDGKRFAAKESFARSNGITIGTPIKTRWGEGIIYAIYKDFPSNTDAAPFDLFCDFGDVSIDDWGEWSFPYYCRVRPGVTCAEAEASAWAIVQEIIRERGYDEATAESMFKPHFVPVRETYFDSSVTRAAYEQGSRSTTMTLLAIAILVILIAVINFINFFFALVPLRVHGVNTRKVLGASRLSLIADNMKDAVVLVLISLVLSAAVVMLFEATPLAAYISCPVAFAQHLDIVALTVGVAVAVSLVASLYPSLYITSFSPAMALKGSFGTSAKGRNLRYALVGVQFVISIALMICASFVGLQRRYMMQHDLGFDRENLLYCQTSYAIGWAHDKVESRLLSEPSVAAISWADGPIVALTRMGWGRPIKGVDAWFQCYPVAWNFPEFLGVRVTEGRGFTPADEQCERGVFLFNEAARSEFGLTLEDKVNGHAGDTEIVGFCSNFNFMPLQYDMAPFCFYVFGREPWRPLSTLYVRTVPGADVPALQRLVADVVLEADPTIDPDNLTVHLLDENIEQQYGDEQRLSRLIGAFTLLAILISLMGVFGLVLFETEHRRREIGVRRVNGATVGEILAMFARRFVWIVAVCFLVAAPLSYWVVARWLADFAVKVPIYWWVFGLAFLVTLAVTVSVVVLRSLRAATANPCESLRTEV